MATTNSTIRGLEDMLMHMLRRCHKTTYLRRIHALMEKLSLLQSNFLVTKMVDICDQNGEIEYARLLFERVINPNIFLYNAMLRAYTHSHLYILTINTYKKMLRSSAPQLQEKIIPDRFTYPFVLRSCGGLLSVLLGKQVHGHVCKYGLIGNNIVVNLLLDMYVKCDGVADARKVFDEMPERDAISWNSLIFGHMKLSQVKKARALFEAMPNKTIVSWTAMISGYTKVGSFGDALDVFRRMQMAGVQPDWVTLVAVLPACAQLGALELGKWIHFYAERNGFIEKIRVCNALIEMYTKCGSMNQALQIFDSMAERDVISWSSMVAGLAHNGRAHEAIAMFHEMQRAKIEPNEITFVGVLSACAHAGLLDEGLKYFDLMQKDYKVEPEIEHYGCMVDLLGRTGNISRAVEVIGGMEMEADSAIWGSVLSSCRSQRDLKTAVVAMERLLELEPEDTGNMVLLANIYADLGEWEGVSRMRKLIRSKKMKKRRPGCSLIEVNGVVQEFVSGDDPKAAAAEAVLVLLGVQMSTEFWTDDEFLDQ
ncbi:pentatricopeptide repeat-containing protein At2g20540 [Andrographis paniculata]|uniref:pentatricopeptide repeat-containing protein At2g20540 n=1 Tax=Andrographis paniculata TaxID=175694 RepID=UPI0021E74F92|nr:pentatricopeptide repeat-containing protein At2g20540 [Andrographis paniculata]